MISNSDSSAAPNRFRLASVVIAIALACTGCRAPSPDTAAGQAQVAGQKCRICILENPGDGAPCYTICMQRQDDQAAYLKAYRR
jgi:hypothetical protein